MQKFLFLYLVYIFLLFNSSAFAQGKELNYSFQGLKIQKPFALTSDNKSVFQSAPYLNHTLFSSSAFDFKKSGCLPVIESPVHYTAFFCKMENSLRERFNVWIKIRAGGDEEYRKMIEKR